MSINFKMSIEFIFSCIMHLYTKFEISILPPLNIQTLPPIPPSINLKSPLTKSPIAPCFAK